MLWPDNTRIFLASGEPANFHLAVTIEPVNMITGLPETFCFWTGWEVITLDLDGNKSLIPTRGGLDIPDPEYADGTEIRRQSVSLFGLSNQADTLLKTYRTRLRPASAWQLCFTQGAIFKGVRRISKGVIDAAPRVIGAKGGGSSLEFQIASAMRSGTRTIASKKSKASYVLRSGDTGMEYASLADVDSDIRGNR